MLRSAVKSHIGTPFIHLSETDSTNRYARNQIDAQLAGHGAVFFADFQSQGRGRQEKAWVSDRGKNILMTVVLNHSGRKNEEAPALNRLIALACFDFFNRLAGKGTSIKWPNDIFWGDRKAGGILIENTWRGTDWTWSMVGIGLNINQVDFPEQAAKATSLQLITGSIYEPVTLALELCRQIDNRLQSWTTEEELSTLAEYNAHLYKKDQPVTLVSEGKQLSCLPLEVLSNGELRVKTREGEILSLREAQWID